MQIDKSFLEGYEDSELIRYDDPNADFPETCAYGELPTVSHSGVLKANRYVNGKLMQTYSERDNHVGIIAATRQGKTTSAIIPTVISNARKKVKCNMILSDPKGEVYQHTAKTLEEEGYKVYLINLRDHRRSECWNPLTPIFRKYEKAMSLADEVETVYEKDRKFYRFMDKEYTDLVELEKDLNIEQNAQLDDVYNDIDLFVEMTISIE